MVKVISRALRQLFPELFNGYHLPMLAKVVAVADVPAAPGISDPFRPKFAVDIQILKSNGTVNTKLPVYSDVPLPVYGAGMDQGMWAFPQPGTIVEVAFAYGNPSKPFIRTILSQNVTTAAVNEGDQVWQHSPGIHQTADAAGNWTRETDKQIKDKSTIRLVEAIEDLQQSYHQVISVLTNSTESIGGTKTIEAMGAMKLLAGEQAILLALKDLKLASNDVLRTYSKGNTEMQIEKELKVIAKDLAHVEAAKVWFGSTDTNAVKVLLDLIQVVSDLANTLKTHTHPHGVPNTAGPVQSGAIGGHKSAADNLHSTLSPIIE